MALMADAILMATALISALYCRVLARRLQRFTALEAGMGGAIAVLSAEVDEMTRALQAAQSVATSAERRLEDLVSRGEGLSGNLSLMVAALHDVPQGGRAQSAARRVLVRRRAARAEQRDVA